MAKKLFKKFSPNLKTIREHKHLKIFGSLLHDPNLWRFTRYSVATAFSVGLFVAFIPVPFQMVLAAALAIVVRSNLPLSAVIVWFTNPVTMFPIFYFCFRVGAFILGREAKGFQFELSFEWLTGGLAAIWQPFLLGCFLTGTTLAIAGNIIVRIVWRYSVSRDWKARRLRKRLPFKKNK